jgi:hypothetical protein
VRRMTVHEVISVLYEPWLQFRASLASTIRTKASQRVLIAWTVQRDTTATGRVLRTIWTSNAQEAITVPMNQRRSLRVIHAPLEPTETTLEQPTELMLAGDVQRDTTVKEDLSCQYHVTLVISAQPTRVSQFCVLQEHTAHSSMWIHSHAQLASSAPPTELTTTPNVPMEPIVEKVRDSQ